MWAFDFKHALDIFTYRLEIAKQYSLKETAFISPFALIQTLLGVPLSMRDSPNRFFPSFVVRTVFRTPYLHILQTPSKGKKKFSYLSVIFSLILLPTVLFQNYAMFAYFFVQPTSYKIWSSRACSCVS